jgi:hypothetical protein
MKMATLTKERWLEIAENIETIAPHLAKILIDQNADGVGVEDAEMMQADLTAAHTAVMYVALCAADKCVFVGVKEREEEEQHGTEQ